MDRALLSLRRKLIQENERGVALLISFSIAMLMLGLIASMLLVSVHRHALMRKRVVNARIMYLTEAGMHDAVARLRIGAASPQGIPATGRWYCLDVDTATIMLDVTELTCPTTTCTLPADVRVCVSSNFNPDSRNQIDVTANF